MEELFRDRAEAGRKLAVLVSGHAARDGVLVLGLPRGGVAVAFEVAQGLGAPLDVLVVRKLGLPGQEELAMCAIASGGVMVLNEEVVRAYQVPPAVIDEVAAVEEVELARRERMYRGARPPPAVAGKTVILVDDGIATGSSMRAALDVLRKQRPARLVVAVPYAPASRRLELAALADEFVALDSTEAFCSVGQAYGDFSQVGDAEVARLMEMAAAGRAMAARPFSGGGPR